ncbi:unnamed protein product [Brassica oleracea var. botrytis]|uniref:BnaCnng11580D protein n=3 Tax=Brassica TaxID=3705 RepID=A0A078I561_BRANA|nr:hypothetical protein HID58_060124 [Brassica napus]CAF1835827.1 unnamed protein product [Brassica napus]CDY44609.1 BnaCnng11580D [Brassica napus]CDY61510.1 BnaCnng37940D [Brassica napus]VDD08774.1 unnamed protein product [Brassica oleracea]
MIITSPMNPPLPRNLTHDPEPEPNAKPVLKSQESSAQTMKPLSPRNPNPPDLDTTEAVISESSAKILPREEDFQEKNEQLSGEKDKMETKPVTEVDSNMVIVKTGGWIIQHRTQYEIAEDAVALLLKHSVGHQEISKSEESGPSRKKKKTDDDSSWVPPQGKAIYYVFLIKSTW